MIHESIRFVMIHTQTKFSEEEHATLRVDLEKDEYSSYLVLVEGLLLATVDIPTMPARNTVTLKTI